MLGSGQIGFSGAWINASDSHVRTALPGGAMACLRQVCMGGLHVTLGCDRYDRACCIGGVPASCCVEAIQAVIKAEAEPDGAAPRGS